MDRSTLLFQPEKRDCRRPVSARVATRQPITRRVFDADDVREGLLQPLLDHALGQPRSVRRIGERHVVCVRLEPLDEAKGVRAMERDAVARSQAVGVAGDRRQTRRRNLDEVDGVGAARDGRSQDAS